MRKILSIITMWLFTYGDRQQPDQSVPWTLDAAVDHAVKNNVQRTRIINK